MQETANECQRHGWRMRKWVIWNLFKNKWNAKLMNKFRELEHIHISLLEKERLKGIESQQIGSVGNQKVHYERLVLEEENETKRSCVFKTNYLCMIADTYQDDVKNLKFVKEKELNLKSI